MKYRWLLLLLLPAIASSQPTVGDLVSIPVTTSQGETLVAAPSDEVEIVRRGGKWFARAFRPGLIDLQLRVRDVRGNERSLAPIRIEIASVLAPDDSREPAPLREPKPAPPNRVAMIAIAIAATTTLLIWAWVFWLNARRRTATHVACSAADELRGELERIARSLSGDALVAGVADATRRYLARSSSAVALSMTTSELLASLIAPEETRARRIAEEILREGDRAKFSPWGSGAGRAILARASALADPEVGWA